MSVSTIFVLQSGQSVVGVPDTNFTIGKEAGAQQVAPQTAKAEVSMPFPAPKICGDGESLYYLVEKNTVVSGCISNECVYSSKWEYDVPITPWF